MSSYASLALVAACSHHIFHHLLGSLLIVQNSIHTSKAERELRAFLNRYKWSLLLWLALLAFVRFYTPVGPRDGWQPAERERVIGFLSDGKILATFTEKTDDFSSLVRLRNARTGNISREYPIQKLALIGSSGCSLNFNRPNRDWLFLLSPSNGIDNRQSLSGKDFGSDYRQRNRSFRKSTPR